MRHWLTLSIALVAPVIAGAQTAATQANWLTNGAEARVVLATSGGISLGSYQAGVNWGLVELLRRVQSDDTLRNMIAESRTAIPRIVGLSGASAGTINSLMSAIHYCTAGEHIRPEESLFWRTWVDVGWRQLMPVGSIVRPPEYGVIDRDYFQRVLLPRLASSLTKPGRLGCQVQIAGSLTKQRAISEEVFDHVMISVQRHVGTYSLMVNDENRMQLRQASPALRADRSLGVQIALAADVPTTTIQVEQIFDLAQASSAIPVVFAPVELAYYRAGDLDSVGVCPRSREHTHTCATPTRARFVDGGAFDNRPISIADRLLAASATEEPVGPNSHLHTIFIVPSAKRVEDATQAVDTTKDKAGGMQAFTQFLGGMWKAASEYELHAYTRSRQADTARRVSVADTIEVTSRAFPIFGEALGHFGAFLARPFREHDFYVGVYDALHFSSDRLCSYLTSDTTTAGLMRHALCHVRTFDALMHRVDVGCTGHYLVSLFYGREHGLMPSTGDHDPYPCKPTGKDALRHDVLRLTAEIFAANLLKPLKCGRSYSAFENTLCGSGLLAFTQEAVRRGMNDSVRVHMSGKEQCLVTYEKVDSLAAACFVDEYFLRLLERPNDFLKRLSFAGLDRVAAVERMAERDQGTPGASRRLGLANSILRSALGSPTRSEWTWDQSSVPKECPNGNLYPRLGWCGFVQSFFRVVVPYYAAAGFGSTVFETGWRPAFHMNPENSIVFPLSFHIGRVGSTLANSPEDRLHRPYISAGIGTMWRNHSILLNECLTSASVRQRVPWAEDVNIQHKERFLYRFSCDVLASRFTVGVTTTRLSFNDQRNWSLTLGFADLNGLLYWMLPQEIRTKF
ncbi:MAG: patatin-like phospholipase family protein [Gemmatimonadaceae bacterium]